MTPRRWSGKAVATSVLAAVALSGCGSTVPLSSQRSLETGGSGAASSAGGESSTGGSGGAASAVGAGSGGGSGGSGSVADGTSAASGGSGGSDSGSGDGQDQTVNPDSPSTTVGSANHSPLTIGLTFLNNSSSAAALGASTSNSLNQKKVAEALVAGFNAAGGLGGRKVDAVEYSFNADDDDWATDAQAACETFTKDNHVSIVLDLAFGTTSGFEACLQKAGVLDITTQEEGDTASSAAATLHANTSGMTVDDTYASVIEGLDQVGYLTPANQTGVIIEDCPDNSAAFTNTLLPLIARLHLKAPIEQEISCTTGFGSAGPAAAAIQNIILKFRSHQVDRVMFVSSNEAVLGLLFASSASSQGYRPGYMLSSSAQAQGLRTNIPSDQWPQLHGVGNIPTIDVDSAPPSAVDNQCEHISSTGGARINSYQDGNFIYVECGPFLLLQTALRLTGGNADPSAVMAAINSLGTSWVGPDLVNGRTDFRPSRHAGPDEVQVFAYNSTCTCMRYTGSPEPAF